jgi:hypothetical protein
VIDVVVIVMAVVVVALVVTTGRRKTVRKQSGRANALTALAPVVGGSVSGDLVLTGRYRGYPVEASLRTGDPSPPDSVTGPSTEGSLVEVLRVRLLGVPGGQPWYAWHRPGSTRERWHFGRPDGSDLLPGLGRLSRLAGLPPTDPDLPDRLRAAGIVDAFERLGPPSDDSFPRARFIPDLREQQLQRLRAAGHELPPSFAEREPPSGPWLEVEVERANVADPTPDRFRALLDISIGIAELNARVNP